MKQMNKWIAAVGGVAALALSSIASAEVPLDNRLTPLDPVDSGAPAVTFTQIQVEYKPGKTKRKSGDTTDTVFFAESTPGLPVNGGSEFSILNANGTQDYFTDGYMQIDAKISPKGVLKPGGTFGIWSQDPMFGTMGYTMQCIQGFKNNGDCIGNGPGNISHGYLVYGGDLKAFGWGGTATMLNDYVGSFWGGGSYGVLEFAIYNQRGWAWDQWGSGYPERLILGIDGGFDLNGANAVTSFSATAKGMAVVPVPAAVWLFGTGLLGLVGFAKRKQRV